MPPSPEHDLLTVSLALRRLAVDLVGASDADDLVQDTWLQTCKLGDTKPRSLKGYVFSALQGLASKHRRSERRRQKRERVAAREAVVPPPDLEVQLHELLHRLNQALLGLPEPYKGTILLRYLQEMTPTAIATFKGEPVATIKSRLQRGLTMLRQELDRDRKDWRQALVLLLAGQRPTPWFARPALLGGAVVVAATVTLWVFLGAEDRPEPLPSFVAVAPPAHDTGTAVEQASGERRVVAPAAERVAQPAPARTHPVPGATLEDAAAKIRVARLTFKEREAEGEVLRKEGNDTAAAALFTEGILSTTQRESLWHVLLNGMQQDRETGSCTALSVVARLAQEAGDRSVADRLESEAVRPALRSFLTIPGQQRLYAVSSLAGFGMVQDLVAIASLPEAAEGAEEQRMAFAISGASILARVHPIGDALDPATLSSVLERFSNGGSHEGCDVLLRACLVHQRVSGVPVLLPARLRASRPQHAALLDGLSEDALLARVAKTELPPDLGGLEWSLRHQPEDLEAVLATMPPDHAERFADGAAAGFRALAGSVSAEVTEPVPTSQVLLPASWIDVAERTVTGQRVDLAGFLSDVQRRGIDDHHTVAAWHLRHDPPLVARSASDQLVLRGASFASRPRVVVLSRLGATLQLRVNLPHGFPGGQLVVQCLAACRRVLPGQGEGVLEISVNDQPPTRHTITHHGGELLDILLPPLPAGTHVFTLRLAGGSSASCWLEAACLLRNS